MLHLWNKSGHIVTLLSSFYMQQDIDSSSSQWYPFVSRAQNSLYFLLYLQYIQKVTKNIKKTNSFFFSFYHHPDEFIQSLIHFVTINIKFSCCCFVCGVGLIILLVCYVNGRSYFWDLSLFILLMIITRLTN